MLELKKKVMGDLQGMLDDRLANRLKPKAVAVEATMVKPGEEESPEASELHGASEPHDEMAEGEGDVSKLTPEEQELLQKLYDKMGC